MLKGIKSKYIDSDSNKAKYLLTDQPSYINRNIKTKYLEALESDENLVYIEGESSLGRKEQ